jgi:SAM-dependent methyltransferase
MTKSFDEFADGYDALLSDPLRDRFAGGSDFFIVQKCRTLLRQLRRQKTSTGRRMRLLDVGCGQGTAVAWLRAHADVVGTDVSMPMLERAVARAPVALQEPYALPFADGTFDAAFAFCIYHHIPDADHVRHLTELRRVVAPGGAVFVFEHNPYNPVTARIFARAPIDQGCHMIAPPRLRSLFHEAGFDDVGQGFLLFVPESLFALFGAVEPLLARVPLGGQYFVSGRRPQD